jgi:hypothetical protein
VEFLRVHSGEGRWWIERSEMGVVDWVGEEDVGVDLEAEFQGDG